MRCRWQPLCVCRSMGREGDERRTSTPACLPARLTLAGEMRALLVRLATYQAATCQAAPDEAATQEAWS